MKFLKCYSGIGKRKTSTALVFLKEGTGSFVVNNKSLEDFFISSKKEINIIYYPLILTNLNNHFDVNIFVKGGGVVSQLNAIKLAISKALLKFNIELKQTLKKHSLLTSDSRIKERRKYGLKKARKASQYSKR